MIPNTRLARPLFVRDPTVSAEDSYSQSARVKLYSHDASSQEDSDIFQFLELKAPSEMGAKSGGLHVHYTDGQAEARLAPSYGPTAFARAASFVLHDGRPRVKFSQVLARCLAS